MRITVVGLGKIGLPLAVQFAASGHTVHGADVDPRTVETVNSGTAGGDRTGKCVAVLGRAEREA